MKVRRVLAGIMSLVMVSASLVGCGTNTDENQENTIVVWSSDSHAKGVMTKRVEEFNSTIGKEKGIKLVWELKENDLVQQLEVAIENGNAPDIFPAISLEKYVENGIIASLDDIEGLKDLVGKNSSVREEMSNVYDGKMYMFPVSSQVYGLAYNKDMFKAAGLVDENGEAKPPATLGEMREYAKLLTNESNQEFGIILPIKWGGWYGMELENTSMGITGSTGFNPVTGKYDYSALKPMLETVLGMKADGSVYPGAEGMDNDPARARFAEGNIGMKLAVSWDVGVWNDQFPAKCDWGIAPIPTVSEDEQYYQLNSYGWSGFINAKSVEEKGADKVATVYNFLYSDDAQREYYKSGVYLPWRADIIETTELDATAKKGWADFGEIVKISKAQPQEIPADTTSFDGRSADFVNRVWSGKITVDEWIEEINKIHNDGIEKYKETHPEEDYSDRIKPDYDRKR